MTPSVIELTAWPDLAALASADPEYFPCLLQSASQGGAQGRFDILFAAPQAWLSLASDGQLSAQGVDIVNGNFADSLHAALPSPLAAALHGLPFQGGWMVYCGYEYAQQIESRLRLPASIDPFPQALAIRCPGALICDHQRQCAYAVCEPDFQNLLPDLAQRAARRLSRPTTELPAMHMHEDAPERYLSGVERVLEYLSAGDVFQVNLSRAWTVEFEALPERGTLYAALCTANPAPFAGWLQWRGAELLSSSPERLFAVDGEHVQTRPIAGTRARLPGDDDIARIRELVGHPKERAEHIMLIDLERNDLGRICRPGSVRVDELMAVESYAHVHHIVSNVSGVLRSGTLPMEVLAAVFPGGTITGCPKVRCMEIIAELEGVGRGVYTGSMGYIDASGAMDMNILIRSLWRAGTQLGFRAGAGIVADSEPERELEETRAKARGLLRALGQLG